MSPTAWHGRLAAFGDAVRFAPPAPATALSSLQAALGAPVVWPAAEIARENREFRTHRDFRCLYMPFDSLLCFGAPGNGDQFFYRILDGQIRSAEVYRWDHENDSRTWRAAGLGALLPSVLTEGARE